MAQVVNVTVWVKSNPTPEKFDTELKDKESVHGFISDMYERGVFIGNKDEIDFYPPEVVRKINVKIAK